MPSDSKLVYSTAGNSQCTRCGKPLQKCRCSESTTSPNSVRPARDGSLILRRETKGRKGKGVTLISGLNLPENELKSFAKSLKTHCGSGGSLKNGVIEIQGDHRSRLEIYLQEKGFKTKISGG